MADSQEDPIVVGVLTGVRWSALNDGPRYSAIRGQLRGGGASHPHATLLSLAKGYLNLKHTKLSVMRATKRIVDPVKRRYVRQCLKNLIRLFPNIEGIPIPVPTPSRRSGRRNLIQFKVAPQVILDGKPRRYIGLWANQNPALTPQAARLYSHMMREGVAIPDGLRCVFEIVDMKQQVLYAIEAEELDEHTKELTTFLESVELDVLRARNS